MSASTHARRVDVGLPAEVFTRVRPGSVASSARRCAALSSLVALTLASCLEYSPNALPTDDSERDLNRKAIARLQAQPPGAADAIRFAVVGDVHYSYDELDYAVDRLNAMEGIEFVVQVGDFTDVGTVQEYRLAKDRFDALRVPYLVVLGNHDMLGRGDEIFDRMFGMRDGTFDYRGARFLMVDTNSREYGFGGGVPRLESLADALHSQESAASAPALASPTFLFSHVPPTSSDFDPDLVPQFVTLLQQGGVTGAFYGHEHSFREGYEGGVPWWIVDAVARRTLLVVTVHGEEVLVEREPF